MAVDLTENYGNGEYFVLEGGRIVAFGFRNRWAAGAWLSFQPSPERLESASRWGLRDRFPQTAKGQQALVEARREAVDMRWVHSFSPKDGGGMVLTATRNPDPFLVWGLEDALAGLHRLLAEGHTPLQDQQYRVGRQAAHMGIVQVSGFGQVRFDGERLNLEGVYAEAV